MLTGVLALVVCFLSLGADAHEQTRRHRAIVQIHPDRTQLLIVYEVPGGEQSQLLRTVWDRDMSGLLDDSEQEALARHLGSIAIAGVTLEKGDRTLELTGGDWRLELSPEPDGPLVVALLLELEGGAGQYRIAMATEAGQGAESAMSVEVEAGEGLQLDEVTGAPVEDGIGAGPVLLLPDDEIDFSVSSL